VGELEEAGQLFQQAYEMEVALGHTHDLAYALNGLGLVAERQGDLKAARAHHEEAVALRRNENSGLLAASLTNLASILHQQGNLTEALERYQEAVALRHERGELPGLLEAIEGLAFLALDCGRVSAASTLMATVREERGRLGIRREAALHGRAAGDRFDADAPPAAIGAAVDLALTLRFGEPGAEESPLDALTAREMDVLRLLGEGLSDQEIAGALYISRATASRHVANIFRKLNVRTRTAAAAWLSRSG
jgi:DNA-binding CsgD family transcriptional regulator